METANYEDNIIILLKIVILYRLIIEQNNISKYYVTKFLPLTGELCIIIITINFRSRDNMITKIFITAIY